MDAVEVVATSDVGAMQAKRVKLYNKLMEAVDHYLNVGDNLTELIFLTGAVDAYREEGFMVPEIEVAFLLIRKATGRRLEGWLRQNMQ